jgi:hypothetical protein
MTYDTNKFWKVMISVFLNFTFDPACLKTNYLNLLKNMLCECNLFKTSNP